MRIQVTKINEPVIWMHVGRGSAKTMSYGMNVSPSKANTVIDFCDSQDIDWDVHNAEDVFFGEPNVVHFEVQTEGDHSVVAAFLESEREEILPTESPF